MHHEVTFRPDDYCACLELSTHRRRCEDCEVYWSDTESMDG